GVRRRQREFELHGSSHRLGFDRHGLAPIAGDSRWDSRDAMLAHVPEKWEPVFRQGHALNQPWIPKRASAAVSGTDGPAPEVRTMRAGPEGSAAAAGPLRSATRRAIAGAGSMKFTGQGASATSRSSSSG